MTLQNGHVLSVSRHSLFSMSLYPYRSAVMMVDQNLSASLFSNFPGSNFLLLLPHCCWLPHERVWHLSFNLRPQLRDLSNHSTNSAFVPRSQYQLTQEEVELLDALLLAGVHVASTLNSPSSRDDGLQMKNNIHEESPSLHWPVSEHRRSLLTSS